MKISDFCYVSDYVANGSFKSLRNNVNYLDDGYAVLVRLTDFTKKWQSDFRYVSENAYKFLKHSKLYAGDLIMANVGDPGTVFIVPDLNKPMTLGPNSILIRPTSSVAHTKFIYWYFKSKLGCDQITSITSATAQKKFNKTSFRALDIKLPPLAEQQRIAGLLDTTDRILKLRESAIIKLDQLSQSVFVELFGDPITNSKKWKLDKLKNKVTFENGDRSSNYPSGSDVIESGVLFLSTKNIVKNQLDLKRRQFISEEKFASLTRGKAKANDLIITLRGTLGSCCIFKNDRAFINAQMMIIRAGDEFVTEFLHSLLTNASMHRHLQEIGNGAAVQQLTAGQLGDMLIPIPPLSIQVQFKNQLNAIKSEIEKNQIALNTVLKLHSSLLHQSFLVN